MTDGTVGILTTGTLAGGCGGDDIDVAVAAALWLVAVTAAIGCAGGCCAGAGDGTGRFGGVGAGTGELLAPLLSGRLGGKAPGNSCFLEAGVDANITLLASEP